MDLDVVRICKSQLELAVEEMLEAETEEELKESFENATASLEGFYNSLLSKID